jgi:putative transposase
MTVPAMGSPIPELYYRPMSRRPRPNLPGAAFHVTARLQNSEHLFEGLQERVVEHLATVAGRQRARLLAYAVMPNHLHLVLVQGSAPLWHFMHPLLSGVSLIIKRRYRRRDHVFGRRYYAVPCLDPEYFRNAIAYVHLNPVRAGMCARADDYRWTTHSFYCAPWSGTPPRKLCIAAETALGVFATGSAGSEECRRAYLQFLAWRLLMDRYVADCSEGVAGTPPERPWTLAGDRYWNEQFTAGSAPLHRDGRPAAVLPPMEGIVRRTLDVVAPELGLELLRSGGRSRALVAVRREVIARALAAGYAGYQIARYLCISTSAVSVVAAGLRDPMPHG